MTFDTARFGTDLSRVRRSRGIPLRVVGIQAGGLSVSTVFRAESGDVHMVKVIDALAAWADLSLDDYRTSPQSAGRGEREAPPTLSAEVGTDAEKSATAVRADTRTTAVAN